MVSDLAYGIVGCSGMGHTHADALADTEGVDLVAGADLEEGIATAFADEYDCEAYADHEAMFADADLDAVSVCTPNGAHAEVVIDAAGRGIDVLCEKPLEVTVERMDRMIEACEDAGVLLAGVFQRRTFGEARRAKRAVEAGELGEVIVADAEVKWHRSADYYEGWHGTRDLDGGVLMTQAIHAIDWLQWVVADIERVCARTGTLHHDVEAPDTAVLAMEFADGTVGHLTGTTAVYPHRPLSVGVHGTEGTVEFGEEGLCAFETRAGGDPGELADHPLGRGHLAQVRDFVEAIEEGREPMIGAGDARRPVEVALAAEESSARDEWVAIEEVR